MRVTRRQLALSFSDFWEGFEPKTSIFWALLSEEFELSLVADGHLHIFSSYGQAHLRHSGRKICFSAENESSPRFGSDFSIGQVKKSSATHLHFPLWLVYNFRRVQEADPLPPRPPDNSAWLSRGRICSVISNTQSRERNGLLELLDSKLPIVHGGRALNNIGAVVDNKSDFLHGFQFYLALENSIGPGYVTEKIYDGFLASCIPIYWGDESVFDFFNERAFLYLSPADITASLERVLDAVADPDRAYSITAEPLFCKDFDSDEWYARLQDVLVENARKALSEGTSRRRRVRRVLATVEQKQNILRYYGNRATGRTFR